MSTSYWLARIVSNGIAYLGLNGAAYLAGVEFSWRLYACAFAFYVLLSMGDATIDRLYPRTENQ